MRLNLRIVLPVAAAIVTVAALLGVLWWQLSQSMERARDAAGTVTPGEVLRNQPFVSDLVDESDTVLLHLRQGDLLALQGDWAGAQAEYQEAVDADGGVAALRKLAQAQLQRRDIDAVRSTLSRLEKSGMKQEDLLFLKVMILLRSGELVQAQTLLQESPESPQKHFGLALVSIIQERHDNAQTELQAVVDGWDPLLRAHAQILLGTYREFASFPEGSPVHRTTLLARALAETQQCELALPLLTNVLKSQNDYRDAWMVQGYCELTTERAAQATTSFEHAYALDPEKPEIQYFLGRAHAAQAEWKDAARYFGYALENGFTPQKDVRKRLAEADAKAGDPDSAFAQYQILILEPDTDLATMEAYILLALQLHKPDDAYIAASSAVTKWPDSEKMKELLKKTEEAKK